MLEHIEARLASAQCDTFYHNTLSLWYVWRDAPISTRALVRTRRGTPSYNSGNGGVSYTQQQRCLISLDRTRRGTPSYNSVTHLATHCDRSCRVTQHGMTHLALCTYPLKLLRAPTPWHHRPRIAPRSSIRRPSPPPSKEQLESLGQPRQTWSIIPDVSEWVP